MKPTVLGAGIAIFGYVVAIYGGWLLYQNAAPDSFGTIPVKRAGESGPDFHARLAREKAERARGNKWGAGLAIIGSTLQLLGTAIAAFG